MSLQQETASQPRVLSIGDTPAKRRRIGELRERARVREVDDPREVDFTTMDLHSVSLVLAIVDHPDVAMECIMQLRNRLSELERENAGLEEQINLLPPPPPTAVGPDEDPNPFVQEI
tara:strand:+ start:4266 stop:4616 length:351 start_codon:yes stop_codon:yes gene_type:complete